MSLHIEQREREGIVILDLKGPLTLGHGDLEVRDRLPALHQSAKVNIVLNLKMSATLTALDWGRWCLDSPGCAGPVEGWRW